MSLVVERQRSQGQRWAAYDPGSSNDTFETVRVRQFVPQRWVWVGKVARASGTYDWCFTVRLPWKWRQYCYNTDTVERGNPRFILRFRGAVTLDPDWQQKISRYREGEFL